MTTRRKKEKQNWTTTKKKQKQQKRKSRNKKKINFVKFSFIFTIIYLNKRTLVVSPLQNYSIKKHSGAASI